MSLKLFARVPRFCARRIFTLCQEDRSFYLSFFLLSFPSPLSPLPRLYLENGRTGRYPDRKRGPWTSLSLFLLSREAASKRISTSRDCLRLRFFSSLSPFSFPHVSGPSSHFYSHLSASYLVSCSSSFVSL